MSHLAGKELDFSVARWLLFVRLAGGLVQVEVLLVPVEEELQRSKRQLAAEVAATQPHITYTTHVHFFPTQSGITRLRRRVEHQSRKVEDFPTTTTNSSHEIEVINIETILSRLGSTFSLEVELMLDSGF